MLNEVLHFAAALADECDDADIGAGVAGNGAQEGRLAHAGAREEPEALATANGGHSVDAAYSGAQGLVDGRARKRRERRRDHLTGAGVQQRTKSINGPTEAIEDAAEHGCAEGDGGGGLKGDDTIAGGKPAGIAQRHDDRTIGRATDDFTGNRSKAGGAREDAHQSADGEPRSGDAEGESADGGDAAGDFARLSAGDGFEGSGDPRHHAPPFDAPDEGVCGG